MGETSGEANTGSLTSRFRFLSWSDDTYSIREFLKAFPLPRVVRITNWDEPGNQLLKSLTLPNDLDLTQPLLLYKKYRQVKIQGKSLKIQKSGKFKEVGGTLLIPESFPGWFTLLSQDGKECSMMLTSLGQVAAARVPAFLTKFDVPVYKLTDSSETGGKSVYLRSTVRGGSILRLLGVWADLGSGNGHGISHGFTSSGSKGVGGGSLGGFGGRLVARSLSHGPQFQYVQCLSHDNEVLFVPFSATGIFYPVAPRGGRNPQHIYPLSAIARLQRLPLKVKMVSGIIPSGLTDFTGTLEIESIETEDTVLACTLLKEKPTLFELDIEPSDLLLSAMTSEDLFIKSTSYQAALNFCRTESDNWKRQVRVCPTIKRKGTLSASTVALRNKILHKTLRIRTSSPPPPSKLSLLFRPNGTSSFGCTKDPYLKRSKSFNVEVQSVSISLTQSDEENSKGTIPSPEPKPMPRKHSNNHSNRQRVSQSMILTPSMGMTPDLVNMKPNIKKSTSNHRFSIPNIHSPRTLEIEDDDEVPYGRVLDDVTEEENIYAEIGDTFTNVLKLGSSRGFPPGLQLPVGTTNRSLGGTSDGGTFSGTFSSSSNPSSREEDIYDNVF